MTQTDTSEICPVSKNKLNEHRVLRFHRLYSAITRKK